MIATLRRFIAFFRNRVSGAYRSDAALQQPPPGWLAGQSLENFEAALERPQFAVRKLADAAFERGVGRGRAVEPPTSLVGEPERQPPAIVGIGLAIDEAGADQSVDRAAYGRRAAFHPGSDLVERRRLGSFDRRQELALLALRFGRSHVSGQSLDQAREPRRERTW